MVVSFLAAAALMPPATSLYDFTVKNIEGVETPLTKYKGKVVVAVNVASKCGNTPQYAKLEKLYEDKKEDGLVILGFPANNFNGQEPGTDAQIKEFCEETYKVKFPMFSKISVKGEDIHPIYKWLLENAPTHEDVDWNFAKFIVGRDGLVKTRFKAKVQPDSEEFMKVVNEQLAVAAP